MENIKHKHHIIPKHMGGSDDPSNLIELTIEQHAEAHRLLFQQYGKIEDELAWKGLAGLIPREQILLEYYKHYRGKNHHNYGKPVSENVRKKISEKLMGHTITDKTRKLWSEQRKGKKHTEETKRKISKRQKEIGNKPPSNKGGKLSTEHKLKISKAHKGKILPKEQIEKIRLSKLGVPLSKEHCLNISKSLKGRKINWELNSTTPEANLKRSLALKGRPKPIVECPHCGKLGGASAMKQWHFDNCKEKK